MQKNDWIDLKIEDISIEGDGIGKCNGMVFFVKDAVIGDRVSAKITKLKKTYGYARLMEIREASPDRVEPRCIYARACGGCQIQQMSYESQLAFKQKKIRDCMLRIGGFDEELLDRVMEPIVGMEEPFGYRNKAQFPIGVNAEGEAITGFYAGRTHDIIANTDCALGVSVNQEILQAVLSYMKEYHVPVYREKERKGLVRHVLIRYGFDSKEIMVCLVVNGNRLPNEEKLAERLWRIPGMKSLSFHINRKDTNVILGGHTKAVRGEPFIQDALYLRDTKEFLRSEKKISYQISPESFYQVNPLQAEKLYAIVLEYAGLTGKETVWDLYCGIGTISLFLAQGARRVYGVETVPKAVMDAQRNARQNGITNVRFFIGQAETILPEFYASAGRMDAQGREEECEEEDDMRHPDVIVADPPRKGCDEKCLETMIQMQPERIVYISCNPATLARDLRRLCDGGYEVKRVRGVDQFGQTVHVETVVCLGREFDKSKEHVCLDYEPSPDIEVTCAATYAEIKEWVIKEYGLKVSSLYVAQVKQKHGIIEREKYNKPKAEGGKVPRCPPEKEAAIEAALRHFRMI